MKSFSITHSQGSGSHRREHFVVLGCRIAQIGGVGLQGMAPRHLRGHALEEAHRTQGAHRFLVAWISRTAQLDAVPLQAKTRPDPAATLIPSRVVPQDNECEWSSKCADCSQ